MYKFTIIIPMYNSGKTIAKAIESIVKQYHKEFKLMICDDGSTDNSISIVKEYQKKYDYIFLEKLPHKGASHARNHGIKNTDTEALLFLDSDDIYKDQALEVISRCYNNEEIMNISYLTKKTFITHDRISVINSMCNINSNILSAREYLAGPINKVYKTDFLNTNQIYFDENLFIAEDMLFNISAVLKTSGIKFVSGDIYDYRFNASSTTNSFNEQFLKNEIIFNDCLKKVLIDNNLFKELENTYLKLTLGGLIASINSYILPKKSSMLEKARLLRNVCSQDVYKYALSNFGIFKNYFNSKEKILIYLLKNKFYFLSIFIIVSTKSKSRLRN